jgi:hypothetical protein
MRRHLRDSTRQTTYHAPARYSLEGLPSREHLFDTGRVEYVKPPPWEEGRQDILNALEAQMPRHTFKTPVPVVVRIVWEHDGEEHVETVALGWTGQHVSPAGSALPVHRRLAGRGGRQAALVAVSTVVVSLDPRGGIPRRAHPPGVPPVVEPHPQIRARCPRVNVNLVDLPCRTD